MPTLYSVAALAVATMYCIWRAWILARQRRHGLLRRRVAWMLWVMADTDDHCAVPEQPYRPFIEDYGYE